MTKTQTNFRLSEADRALLQSLADQHTGGDKTAMLEQLIRQEAQRRGLAQAQQGETK